MLPQNKEAPTVESTTTASSPNADVKSDDLHNADERVVENGSAYDKSEEDNVKSAPNSPFAGSAIGSPSREFVNSNFEKNIGTETSPRNKETNRYF